MASLPGNYPNDYVSLTETLDKNSKVVKLVLNTEINKFFLIDDDGGVLEVGGSSGSSTIELGVTETSGFDNGDILINDGGIIGKVSVDELKEVILSTNAGALINLEYDFLGETDNNIRIVNDTSSPTPAQLLLIDYMGMNVVSIIGQQVYIGDGAPMQDEYIQLNETGVIINSESNRIDMLSPVLFMADATADSEEYTYSINGFTNNLYFYAMAGLSMSSPLVNLIGTTVQLSASRIYLPSLPTSDPLDGGVLWNDGGTIKISNG